MKEMSYLAQLAVAFRHLVGWSTQDLNDARMEDLLFRLELSGLSSNACQPRNAGCECRGQPLPHLLSLDAGKSLAVLLCMSQLASTTKQTSDKNSDME